MGFTSKVLEVSHIAKDVTRLKLEKPKDFTYTSGLSIMLEYNHPDWIGKKKPLTLTSTPKDPFLEVMAKQYLEKGGLSCEIHNFKGGEEIIITKPFGKYSYKGRGTFIAMGIGITPFVSILRSLGLEEAPQCKIIISNKTFEDIALKQEFEQLLGKENVHFVLTKEQHEDCTHGRINEGMLKKFNIDINGYFYICGSTDFKNAMKELVLSMGASKEKIIA